MEDNEKIITDIVNGTDNFTDLVFYKTIIENKINDLRNEIRNSKQIVITCPSCKHIFRCSFKDLDRHSKTISDDAYDYKNCPKCHHEIPVYRSLWNDIP